MGCRVQSHAAVVAVHRAKVPWVGEAGTHGPSSLLTPRDEQPALEGASWGGDRARLWSQADAESYLPTCLPPAHVTGSLQSSWQGVSAQGGHLGCGRVAREDSLRRWPGRRCSPWAWAGRPGGPAGGSKKLPEFSCQDFAGLAQANLALDYAYPPGEKPNKQKMAAAPGQTKDI